MNRGATNDSTGCSSGSLPNSEKLPESCVRAVAIDGGARTVVTVFTEGVRFWSGILPGQRVAGRSVRGLTMQATFRRLLLRLPQIAGSPGLRPSSLPHRLPTLFVLGCLLWTAASTLSVYPHQLAYFNEAAGGPENGHEHLLGSSLDWGQDLLHLRDFVLQDTGRSPILLCCEINYDPDMIGLDFVPLSAFDTSISHRMLMGTRPAVRVALSQVYSTETYSASVQVGHRAKSRIPASVLGSIRDLRGMDQRCGVYLILRVDL